MSTFETNRINKRNRDLYDIKQLYGTDTPQGREMLQEVMGRYLLAILPDDAIHELAEMHRAADARGGT